MSNKNTLSSVESRVFVDTMSSEETNRARAFVIRRRGGRGGAPHIKGLGMLVVLLRGVNFGFWLTYGVLGKTLLYLADSNIVSFRGQKNLGYSK